MYQINQRWQGRSYTAIPYFFTSCAMVKNPFFRSSGCRQTVSIRRSMSQRAVLQARFSSKREEPNGSQTTAMSTSLHLCVFPFATDPYRKSCRTGMPRFRSSFLRERASWIPVAFFNDSMITHLFQSSFSPHPRLLPRGHAAQVL